MSRAIIVLLLVLFVCFFFNDQVWSAYVKRQSLEKPGVCPKPTGPGICVELCSGDDDCPGKEKCCSNGCGHVCMRPVQKPSRCPKPIGPGICVEMCSADDGCPIGEKCCSNGCGHVCMKPVSGKRELKPPPGSCPKPTGPGLCAEMCFSGCPKGQKCCSNGCGHQCMNTV